MIYNRLLLNRRIEEEDAAGKRKDEGTLASSGASDLCNDCKINSKQD